MKKLFIISLCFILMLSVCSCGDIAQFDNIALFELDLSILGEINVYCFDSNEKYTAVLYSDSNENAEQSVENEEYLPQKYYLSVIETYKSNVKKTVVFNNPDMNSFSMSADDCITIYNEQKGKKTSYDFDLNILSIDSYKFEEYYDKGAKIGIDTARFNCLDSFAVSSSFGVAQSIVFYDNPETYYMIKNNIYYDFRNAVDYSILTIDYEQNKNDIPISDLHIFDFDKMCEINSVTIPNPDSNNYIASTNYNKFRATALCTDENGKNNKIYVWNYQVERVDKPFDKDYCAIIEKDKVNDKIDELESKIKINYGIELECNADKNFIAEQYKYENDFQPIYVYQCALDIEYYLSKLPINLFSEILCMDIKNAVADFDELRIYLVGSFPNQNIDAFASNIGCEETDDKNIVYIVYSCTGLSQKTFYHEFMHTMEYRIWNYEDNFDDKWAKLNPNKFEYDEDYTKIDFNDELQQYFTRDYGMSGILEDRATCFEELCDSSLSNDVWWENKPNIVDKEKYLSYVLKKSFPCFFENSIWDDIIAHL